MLIITIAALGLVGLLSVLVFLLAYRLISNKPYKSNNETVKNTTAQSNSIKANDNSVPDIAPDEKFNCSIHTDLPASGLCVICSESFCHTCIKTHNNLSFCKKHLELYLVNQWKDVVSVKTSPQSPEEGHYLYDFKEYLWSKDIPTLIQTKYKIDIHQDRIESYVTLIGREEDYETLKQEEASFKSSSAIN